jgi:hypothetical protein
MNKGLGSTSIDSSLSMVETMLLMYFDNTHQGAKMSERENR